MVSTHRCLETNTYFFIYVNPPNTLSKVHQIKQATKKLLEKSDTYLQFRYSDIYLNHWKTKVPAIKEEIEREGNYFLKLIEPLKKAKGIIYDIGANEGFVTEYFLQTPHTTYAIEPDAKNQRVLQARFKKQANFRLIPKAISNTIGTTQLYIHTNGSPLNTMSEKWKTSLESGKHRQKRQFSSDTQTIETTTLDALIAETGTPDFIKIDVEGHELAVIEGLTQPVPFLCFEANLPEFLPETRQIIRHLQAIDPQATFNYSENYEVQLSHYIKGNQLQLRLNHIQANCIDVLCKMD